MIEPIYDYDDLIALFWIRSSGLIHYKWYAHQSDAKRLESDDFFLSGFIQAISSLGLVFFENSYLSQIRFYGYKMFLEAFSWKDQLVLIVRENIMTDLANSILQSMIRHYKDAPPTHAIEFAAENDNTKNEITQFWKNVLIDHGFPKDKLEITIPVTTKDSTTMNPIESIKEIETGPENLEKINQHLRNKMESYAVLGKTMGHSLNNVLASILGNINLTMLDLPPDSENYANLHDAEIMIGRAKDLATQLMTLAIPLQKNSPQEVCKMKSESYSPFSIDQSGILSSLINENTGSMNIIPPSGKILILEDEEAVSTIEKKILNRMGYEVELTNTGEQTIEKVRQAHANGERYVLAILDYMIKGGLGGIETVKHIRAIQPDMKCIIASGLTEDPIFTDYAKFQFDAAVKKPFDFAELAKVLKDILK